MSKTPSTPAPYVVERSNYDAARPWIVLRTFRSFNRGAGRYPDEVQARRRARDLTRRFKAENAPAYSALGRGEQFVRGVLTALTGA